MSFLFPLFNNSFFVILPFPVFVLHYIRLFIIISKSIVENLLTLDVSPIKFIITIPFLMTSGAVPFIGDSEPTS